MSDNNKKRSAYSQLRGFHRAVPIVLFAIALFVAICFINQNTGALGRAIAGFLLGSFSIGGYFIPALIAIHAMFYATDVKSRRVLISRIIFSLAEKTSTSLKC